MGNSLVANEGGCFETEGVAMSGDDMLSVYVIQAEDNAAETPSW
jgi:hypothetical protein